MSTLRLTRPRVGEVALHLLYALAHPNFSSWKPGMSVLFEVTQDILVYIFFGIMGRILTGASEQLMDLSNVPHPSYMLVDAEKSSFCLLEAFAVALEVLRWVFRV